MMGVTSSDRGQARRPYRLRLLSLDRFFPMDYPRPNTFPYGRLRKTKAMNSRSIVFALTLLQVGIASTNDAQAADRILYGSDVGSDELGAIDRSSGVFTTIGSQRIPGLQAITGLAYDRVNDIMYGINPSSDRLYTLDTTTGLATAVGGSLLPFSNANGLAYDPNNQILYGSDIDSNTLFTIDVGTGTPTLIGSFGGAGGAIEGLAYDAASDTLYGLSDNFDKVVVIDPVTVNAMPLPNALPEVGNWRGLAFDPEQGVLWASISFGGVLNRVDPATGIGTSAPWTGRYKGWRLARGLSWRSSLPTTG